jgi:hypothetical protein
MKDMLASLPEFQETRDKVRLADMPKAQKHPMLTRSCQFSLHLDMAQECMALFEKRKLTQTADIEQVSGAKRRWNRADAEIAIVSKVLRDRRHRRGQATEVNSRGDGTATRRQCSVVSANFQLIAARKEADIATQQQGQSPYHRALHPL